MIRLKGVVSLAWEGYTDILCSCIFTTLFLFCLGIHTDNNVQPNDILLGHLSTGDEKSSRSTRCL